MVQLYIVYETSTAAQRAGGCSWRGGPAEGGILGIAVPFYRSFGNSGPWYNGTVMGLDANRKQTRR